MITVIIEHWWKHLRKLHANSTPGFTVW